MRARHMPLGTLLDDVVHRRPGPSESIVLRHLIDAIWPASLTELMDALCSHREDGGPCCCPVWRYMTNIRRCLRPGFLIHCNRGVGWRLLREEG